LPLRIVVGHKGIGKSALFQVAIDEEYAKNRLTILIKPDDIVGIGEDADFLKMIREWKRGINEIIAMKSLTSFGLQFDDGWRSKLNQFGGKALEYLSSTLKIDGKVDINPSKKAILANFLKHNKISVYIDDLDRGWEGRKNDIRRISALLNAVRDISTESRGIFFRVSLRSDVYYLVRTSDESTDKIEGSVIWYSWTNHEILVLLIKRIESFFAHAVDEDKLLSMSQPQLMRYLLPIMEEKFTGKGHWENVPMYRVLMSLIRKRLRDLVKLLTLAGREAKNKNGSIIQTQNLESIFEEYSQGRLQDTINEYRSELPDIERLLLGMKPSKRERTTAQSYVYTTAELYKKLQNVQESGKIRAANNKNFETKDLAAFLYKINFITARKKTPEGIDRKYFEENRYLSNQFTDFGYDWEIHPAYRWALQPDSPMYIFSQLELSL
jgi:hypothetical protein